MCSVLALKEFYPSTLFVDAIGIENENVFVLEIVKFSDKKVLCRNMSFLLKLLNCVPWTQLLSDICVLCNLTAYFI